MKPLILSLALAFSSLFFLPESVCLAQNAPPAPTAAGKAASMPDFSPPPVPGFMLRPQSRPMTLEEMQKEADEAAQKARNEAVRKKNPAPELNFQPAPANK